MTRSRNSIVRPVAKQPGGKRGATVPAQRKKLLLLLRRLLGRLLSGGFLLCHSDVTSFHKNKCKGGEFARQRFFARGVKIVVSGGERENERWETRARRFE